MLHLPLQNQNLANLHFHDTDKGKKSQAFNINVCAWKKLHPILGIITEQQFPPNIVFVRLQSSQVIIPIKQLSDYNWFCVVGLYHSGWTYGQWMEGQIRELKGKWCMERSKK